MNSHHFNQLYLFSKKKRSTAIFPKKKIPSRHTPPQVDCIKLPFNLKGKKLSTNAQIHIQVTNSDNHAEYKRGLQLD